MSNVVLVDKNDNQIGLEDKVKAHLGQGILHRAFTILVFNDEGEVLIQKRAKDKMLWPLIWETTCASHPFENEKFETAGEKRLKEEFGFTCPLKMIDKFYYQATYKDIGSEHEVCALLIGEYNGKVRANPNEIAEWKWISLDELREAIKNNPDQYAPWLKISLEKIKNKINM